MRTRDLLIFVLGVVAGGLAGGAGALYLAAPGAPETAAELPPELHAVTIHVAPTSALILPGDRVDILLTLSHQRRLVGGVILRDIAVVAIDQDAGSDPHQRRSGLPVMVAVDTDQAQKLDLAEGVGTLSLLLRGQPPDGQLRDLREQPFPPVIRRPAGGLAAVRKVE